MIDPGTKWFEIVQYNDKQADKTENLVYKMWLCRYTLTTIIMYDRGNEFLGYAFKKI